MNRHLFLLAILFFPSLLLSQSYTSKETTEYIQKYHKTAIREMYKYKIPASITLAQGILESGSGRSNLAVKANNHFGIKCGSDYSGKKFFKNDDKRNDCFRVYSSADESFRDHSVFLTKSRYASLFNLKITDYKGWAKGLKQAGYATSNEYPTKLIAVIEQNNLTVYDRNPESYISKKEAEDYSLNDEKKTTPTVLDNTTDNNTDNKDSKNKLTPKVVNGKINGVKCYCVKQGDTFYRISKNAGLTVDQLLQYNDFPSGYSLKAGEYIFLEEKQKKNKSFDYHTVQRGDTWLSISQLYGIQLARLKKLNKSKSHTESMMVGGIVKLH